MSKGIVTGIFIAPSAGAPMELKQTVLAIAGAGLEGDRYALGQGSYNKNTGVGKRQVTLINARFFYGTQLGPSFRFGECRRNIYTENVELMYLIGQEFKIGETTFRGIKYCDPCNRPAKLANRHDLESFKKRFADCGGLIAEVVERGLIKIGDSVIPPSKSY